MMRSMKTIYENVSHDLQSSLAPHPAPDGNEHRIPGPGAAPPQSLRRFTWPPGLTSPPSILGEITDVSGRRYPRDMGRSIQLGGHTYYMFGDTFCFDTSDDFVGVTNNTIALIQTLENPTQSHWLTSEAKIAEFVPLSEEEARYCKDMQKKGENKRYVHWAFGGIIEIPGSCRGEGWLFYDMVEIHGAEVVKLHGIGLAKARITDFETGMIQCERVGRFPLFDPAGPAFGNMSTISAEDGWTYLLGGLGLDNYMARIRTADDFSNNSNYEFLAKGGHWVKEYEAPYGPFGELAHDILHGQGQGAIVYVPEYAPKGKPFMWFGNEKFPTSALWVGVAQRPEGPWEVCCVSIVPEIGIGTGSGTGKRYCMYPHLWGSDLQEGKVLLTWSDDATMGGKVIAGILCFSTDEM